MKGHSWRCFYRIARKKIRWGCDRGAERENDERVQIEMLGGNDEEMI